MEEIKEYVHTVQYYETDKMGITHHSNYIRWMEEARVDFLSQIGWDYARLEESGIISPVLNLSCDFKKTTTFSDKITIMASVKEFNGVKLKFAYEMRNEDGAVVFTATSMHAFLNREGRPVRMKQDFPELYETIENLIG
ncbi:MAG: acyl-CoA thioesterase [Lachnospiraceae bacterium]|nr:acyl-CoA thioesterase [Lachnospiraceae bacterium]MBP3754958.1 acyl-CoA thioesterase [Lachnospiraceae bacterium]